MKLANGKKENRIIYLDFAATTPTRKEVVKAMAPFWGEEFGNPSSIHQMGRRARSALDKARAKIAEILDSEEGEIYFTSGGTESDNLAIRGVAKSIEYQVLSIKDMDDFSTSSKNKKTMDGSRIDQPAGGRMTTEKNENARNFEFSISNFQKGKPHLITTQIEHHAVLNTFKQLEKEGFAVTYLPVDQNGVVDLEALKAAIRPETFLVSVMYVNNEIGVVQPIKEIGKIIETQNEKRKTKNFGRIYFHTDAVQAAEYFSLNTKRQHVHMLSLSAHKFGGPKGVGLLYVDRDVPILPVATGGEQELVLRPGTENVAAIVGMAKALELATDERYREEDKKIGAMRNYFEKKLKEKVGDIQIMAEGALRSPGISAVAFLGLDPSAIVMNLDLAGICVSSGAACSAGSVERSHVIEALHLPEFFEEGSVRFSFGRDLKKEDIDIVILEIQKIIERLRKENQEGI